MRPLVTLGVLVLGLLAALLGGTRWSDATITPGLALDLEGGTEIILHPVAEGGQQATPDAIKQAIDIIRSRVDASGVAEAEITSQGRDNIVVALPGEPDEATLALVRESAQMVFRPVLVVAAPTPAASPTPTPTADPTSTPAADVTPTDPSDPAWLTDALLAEFEALDCTDPANLSGGAARVGDPAKAIVTCDESGTAKYALGPVEVRGEMITGASSGLESLPGGGLGTKWITTVSFDGAGTVAFRDATTRLKGLESPRDQFGIVLDGLVVSAPQVNEIIPTGEAIISGTFTRDTAATLARQLNFGALPLTFDVQSEAQISATLGSEQLQRGMLAGLIGLILVGVYSLAQYRALGLVTIMSLVAAAALAYLAITTLSWLQGYRLSLPGVAALVVAIGITADSFIVYFERIKDELREGRTLAAAIDQGWARAQRTILASDAVSFLAAVVLYFLAVGGVRGFAFTLGMTTLIDLMIVFMFTHPVMILISRHRFFAEGHPFSGLDPGMLGARSRYLGRGRVATGTEPADRRGEPLPAAADAGQFGIERLTIAERKAAQRRAAEADQARIEGEDA